MVAPLDPLRGPTSTPQTGAPRRAPGTEDAFEIEFQRLLQNAASQGVAATPPTSGPTVLSGDDLAASLDGVSESLKRAAAYINTARAYFKSAPPPPSDPEG